MTFIFPGVTLLTLLMATLFAQATGMATTSHFGLIGFLGCYFIWQSRKHFQPALAAESK